MGNRAVIILTDGKQHSPSMYLHWNGGPESVYAFIDEMPVHVKISDVNYSMARLCQIVGNFFSKDGNDSLSVGVSNGPESVEDVDELYGFHPGDNGIYIYNVKTKTMTRFSVAFHFSEDVEREAFLARASETYASIRESVGETKQKIYISRTIV